MVVSRVRWPGSTPKLVNTWTGPWRIVAEGKVPVHGIQSIVTGEVKEVYVVRLRFYAALFGQDRRLYSSSLRWPGSSIFRRQKRDRILTSKRTGLNSTGERVRGIRLRRYGTAPRSLLSRSCGS